MTSASILGVGLCLLAATSLTWSSSSSKSGDTFVAGVSVGNGGMPGMGSPVVRPGTIAAGTLGIDIDFDDVAAPCDFASTQPLRGQYAAQGVIFWGQDVSDGGAILNECGGFGVTGYSAPNFLGFNSQALYSTGGVASAPEFMRLLLLTPVSHIEVRAGAGFEAGTLTLIGVRSNGTQVASSAITLGPALQTVAVNGEGMVGAILMTSVSAFVVDDFVAN